MLVHRYLYCTKKLSSKQDIRFLGLNSDKKNPCEASVASLAIGSKKLLGRGISLLNILGEPPYNPILKIAFLGSGIDPSSS